MFYILHNHTLIMFVLQHCIWPLLTYVSGSPVISTVRYTPDYTAGQTRDAWYLYEFIFFSGSCSDVRKPWIPCVSRETAGCMLFYSSN